MDMERIKDRIRDIARNPKHVRFEELQTLLDNNIQYAVEKYNHRHGTGSHHAFTVGNGVNVATFCIPHRRPFVLKVYAHEFLKAMVKVGLYDPEE